MRQHRTYITPEMAAETVPMNLSCNSRLIVTGQIGCGKTTLAKEISRRLSLTHLHLDDFHGDADPHLAAAQAAIRITGGWVAEANVWQIPQGLWDSADLVIWLDYGNLVHYLRILRRCWGACARGPTWTNIRHQVGSEWDNMKVIYRWANKNRKGWQERGLNANRETPVVRCGSPHVTSRLVARLGTPSPLLNA